MRRSLRRSALAALAAAVLLGGVSAAELGVMPAPAEAHLAAARFPLRAGLTVALTGVSDERLRAAAARLLQAWERRTGLRFTRNAEGAFTFARPNSAFVIACEQTSPDIPQLGENESYQIEIGANRITLQAATVTGALRGLATFQQLPLGSPDGWFLPAMAVRDAPRFAWRGLLIDSCRHWIPADVIRREIDAMALLKLNVLHFHLTDDQGFRIESRRFPRLQEVASDGEFYTQDQIRDLIAYAAARGIRVMPEFDVPGHATGWVVAFPELASLPGPYVVQRHFGVQDPTLDPTNEKTYAMLEGFIAEMAALFPDAYFHIGGDENNGKQWTANASIQNFIREHHLGNNAGLHAYFNRRLEGIVRKNGKIMVGWEEILNPALPPDTVVQIWKRPANRLPEAVRAGFNALWSRGNYLNSLYTAAEYYQNDPVPENSPLTPAEQARVIGGEASVWTEWIDANTLDFRLWPRTAAVAERLWSPRSVQDLTSLYRRLELVSLRLEEAGLQHRTTHDAQVRVLAGDGADPKIQAGLRMLLSLMRPVGLGVRQKRFQPEADQFTPLTTWADCTDPDSLAVRVFDGQVRFLLSLPSSERATTAAAIAADAGRWTDTAASLRQFSESPAAPPRLAEGRPLFRSLAGAAQVCRTALAALSRGETLSAADFERQQTELAQADQAHCAVEFAAADALRQLLEAAEPKNR